jgi:hypothetical protein
MLQLRLLKKLIEVACVSKIYCHVRVQLVLIPPHNFGVGNVVITGFRKLRMYFKIIYAVNNSHLSKPIIIIIIIIIITWTPPDGKNHNHILIGGGIPVCSMYDLTGELSVILITIWCLQKLGKDWQ